VNNYLNVMFILSRWKV